MGMNKSRKGFIFTIDAILGLTLLIMGIIIISKITYIETQPNKQVSYISEDITNYFANTKIGECKNPYVIELINEGVITELNISVIEQIGYLWAENNTEMALAIASNVTEGILPRNMGLRMFAEESEIYSFNTTDSDEAKELVSSKSLISGIALARPIRGTSSRIYLAEMDEQSRVEYIYFGGFEGEGNITKFIDLPTFTGIEELEIEIDSGADFDFYINGDFCMNIDVNTSNESAIVAERFDLMSCNESLISDTDNYFTVDFEGSLNESYIGGGFIKIEYSTSELYSRDFNSHNYYFPGIIGIINLYSSMYVPGELNNMEIYLHYEINNSNTSNVLFLNIGNTTVYEDRGTSGVVTTTINNSNLSSILDYNSINGSTLPLRLGFENLSFQQVVAGGEGRGDAVLITDESGSMAWRMDNNNYGYTRDCDDADLEEDSTSRMSVAKCVAKDFVRNVLENVTGNRVGLVSYAYYANENTSLTTDIEALEDDIEGYSATGATCISCGIYSATQLLLSEIQVELQNDTWLYNSDYQYVSPPSNWTESGFDDSNWSAGSVVLGFGTGVDTEVNTTNTYLNLWDMAADSSTPEVDFTSGINSSVNTFIGSLDAYTDDGWDWDTGIYDYSNGQNDGVVSGRLRQYSTHYYDTSAAYGIQINITQEAYDLISSGAVALVSFDYEWDGRNPYFESSDQVWIKGRWTSPTSGTHYLGSTLDSGHSHSDGTFEIDTENNPDNDFSDSFSQDVSEWIEGPGYYYLDFGGKLDRSWYWEYGYFYFDNILFSVRNNVGDLYFRDHFEVEDLDVLSDMDLYVYSDDRAEVYLNGNLIDNDTTVHNASYWNRDVFVNKSYLVEGDNVMAVKLYNNDSTSAKFDLELKANSSGRVRAMLVMSDGEANRCHGPDDGLMDNNGWSGSCGSSNSKQEAIDFACYAHTNYNISIYAVAFSASADTSTLQSIADCDNSSHFYQSDNVSGLQEIYQDIAESMVDMFVEQEAQVITVSGNFSENTLYSDSYILLNYSRILTTLEYGEMPIYFEERSFTDSCSPSVDIPEEVRVIESKFTSYSGSYWTNFVEVNSNNIFNLSGFGSDYTDLGDPFIVNIDPDVFVGGNNDLGISLGVNGTNTGLCSINDSFMYTGLINLLNISLPYSTVLPLGIGCSWEVEFDDGSTTNILIPTNYTGNKTCNYTSSSISYDSTDSYDEAAYNLFNYLDFDQDGRVYLNFESSDLIIETLAVERIPYLWGPSVIEFRAWQ